MDFGVELAIAKYNEGVMLMWEEYKLWPGLRWKVKESQVDAAGKGSVASDFDGYIVTEYENEGGYSGVEMARRHMAMIRKIVNEM